MRDKCIHTSHATVHHYDDGPDKPCNCGRYANVTEQDNDPVTVEDQEAEEQAEAIRLLREEK